MEIVIVLVGVTLLNLGIFYVYYHRTKRIVFKTADLYGESNLRLMGRIERRLASPAHVRPRPVSGIAIWAIVVTYGRQQMLERTLRSLRRHEPDISVLVVDNGSTDGTAAFLERAHAEGLVDKVLLNAHDDVPQWQKAYSIHQASALLAIEPMTHLVILDDDVEVAGPFVERALGLLDTLRSNNVRLVSLLTDEEQNHFHPTLETVVVDGVTVRIKESFNGAFVFMPIETFEELRLPPIREGGDILGAEDWFWSRQLQAHGERVACVENATHLGMGISKRMEVIDGRRPGDREAEQR